MKKKRNGSPIIHVTNKEIMVIGEKYDLMSLFATIVQVLKNESNLSESDIKLAFYLGLKDKKEIQQRAKENMNKFIDELFSEMID